MRIKIKRQKQKNMKIYSFEYFFNEGNTINSYVWYYLRINPQYVDYARRSGHSRDLCSIATWPWLSAQENQTLFGLF